MTKIKICEVCDSDKINTNQSLGMTYCEDCGALQEENTEVTGIQFSQNNGVSSMSGQIHKITDNIAKINNSFISVSNHFIQNTIRSICMPLGLGEDHATSAQRWYKLLLPHNISKGKGILYTLSACVYIVCRQERTCHLLIDFSVLLRLDVYKIGKVYQKIVKTLKINLPFVDPCVLVKRYAQKLDIDEDRICNLAIRLVRRMERDWILTGRTPNCVCGAALVVASRVFGKSKGFSEVGKIVNGSSATISKRIEELKDTKSATLKVSDFMKVWLEREENPPIVKRALYGNNSSNNINSNSSNNSNNTEELLESPFSSFFEKNSSDSKSERSERAERDISTEKELVNKKDITNEKDNTSISNVNMCKINIEDLDMTIKEDEIDALILNEDEIEQKKMLWEAMYGDYVEKQKNKSQEKPIKNKRKKKQVYKNIEDAFKSIVEEKKLSSNINYDAIENFLAGK